MILRYRDVRKRNSNFVYNLLTSTSVETVNQILKEDPELLTFEITINGQKVPLQVLEDMYNDMERIIDVKSKYRSLKILEQLKEEIAEKVEDAIDIISSNMNEAIVNYIDEIQMVGVADAVARRTEQNKKGN